MTSISALAYVTGNLVETIQRQHWLDRVAEPLSKAVARAYEAAGEPGRIIKDALHGTWLGHPLHPVLTDVPLGAWTAAVALDILDAPGDLDARGDGRPSTYGRGADTALGVGVVGALGAAVTGLTDWHHTDGETRRLGLAHGLLNSGALALMVGSLALRRRHARREARLLAGLGYALAMASAYLGGHLVFRQRIGVDHSQPGGVDRFVPSVRLDELSEGQPRRVDVEGVRVLLVRRGQEVQALNEICAHLGGPLADGRIEGDSVTCPWHGSRFSLVDGSVLAGPATAGQPCYAARVRADRVIEVNTARSTPARSQQWGRRLVAVADT
jgi:nitrite reductase/ring-hydroxylating ferredoxin subunit/uncharacterized membrane protein